MEKEKQGCGGRPKDEGSGAEGSGAGAGGAMAITTPMPGKVVQLACAVGDTMEKGDPLLILEAMKMEHVIRAPSDGVVVARLPFGVGDFVEDGQVLVGFEDTSEQ